MIKSGLFFGETTFHKSFLLSGQESLQDFSVSFDVCLVGEEQIILCVKHFHSLRRARALAKSQRIFAFGNTERAYR